MHPFTVVLVSALIVLSPPALAQDLVDEPAPPPPFAFTDARVFDVLSGEVSEPSTVVVRDRHVAAIGGAVPAGMRTIDAAGKYLLPGLWDMHVHATASPGFSALYIANGVTGVRDMYTMMPQIEHVRGKIADGEVVGPRIVAAGRIVDGEKPVWPGSVEALDADGGRQAVATVQEEGSDFVKVYSKLSRAAYFAIAEEAKARELPFAGHVPRQVTVLEASIAGQRSIEHLTGVVAACSSSGSEVFDPERAAVLFATLKKNGTWQCPTLTVLRAISHLDDEEFRDDDRLQYLPGFWRGFWQPKSSARFRDRSADDWRAARAMYGRQLEVVKAMAAAGVPILAGTDVANPYCFPGFSLHDELALLVDAGLSPLAAVQAATISPAVFLGRSAELGTVEVGKFADLVLLDANPVADIHNTGKIAVVVANGVLYDRAALDQILAAARR